MLNLTITDIKSFVHKLLIEEAFDTFLLVEANVKSGISYYVSGQINKAFFDSEELQGLTSDKYVTWSTVRPHIYNIIKGKNMPLGFKLIFILSDANTERIIEKNNLPITSEDVAALSLNILFDGQSIHITTSASLKAFSLDKTLERLWDENLEAYFKQQQISYEKH